MTAKIIDGKQVAASMLLFNTITSAERAAGAVTRPLDREEETLDTTG